MTKRKGISDVIAVVLMISVAISIGVFVTTFATKWVQDQTSSQDISCAIKTNYIVEEVRFNYSGRSELTAKVTNKGENGLYGFGFVLENVTKIVSFDSTDAHIGSQVSATSPLGREQAVILSLRLNETNASYSGIAPSLTKVRITNDGCKAVSASSTSVTIY